MAAKDLLANILGTGNMNLRPSPMRSAMVQALMQQAAQPQRSVSPIQSLNIASQPVLAALLARREEAAQKQFETEVAQRQQGFIGAIQRRTDPNRTSSQREAARQASQIIASNLPSDNPVVLAAAERQLAQSIPDPADFASSTANNPRVQSVREGKNGNWWIFSTDPAVPPKDTGIAFAENVRWIQNEDGTVTPVLGSDIERSGGAGTVEKPNTLSAEQQAAGASRLAAARASGDAGAMQFDQMFSDARDARNTLRVLGEQMQLVEEGIRAGSLAGARQSAARFFDTFIGRPTDEQELTANTDAYIANAGQLVADIIKEFGAGTGLSDADREYAARIAGGDINVDEFAIKELLRIQAETNYFQAEEYNRTYRRYGQQAGVSGIYGEVELSLPFQGYEDVNGDWVDFIPIGTVERVGNELWRYKGGGSNRDSSWEKL